MTDEFCGYATEEIRGMIVMIEYLKDTYQYEALERDRRMFEAYAWIAQCKSELKEAEARLDAIMQESVT